MTSDPVLIRIAEALERLSPPPSPAASDTEAACMWNGSSLIKMGEFRPVPINLLSGIDAQKAAVLNNGRRLAAGHAAHDVLLWGARGAGKSALVKSSVAALQSEGADIRLVEVPGGEIARLGDLFQVLAATPRPTIVFIDDMGFDGDTGAARHLRSVLEGGVTARPAHVRLYVTSNRRHILPRSLDEQESAINPRDVVDDKMALVDRFGLSLGFHVCDQDTYLTMVAGYATHLGLPFDTADALLWSTQRGARSGRMAWHYAVELAGRAGKPI